ncbi:Crp/Fnr family transcriptional regulator [Lutibacter sp. B1]|uniref:Crp/Fnr family transcriptional regulator n=1 Tax=Lutibacter sp. B1 TaxID=2725996 RepID=UPI001456C263|nr:Crp/Fnr family transcriptional regulator [Lutibacter sp. B1]NLP58752.1 Crp/Fnr family transcriptional regulator [Lutibacter sp. B1]
MSSIWYLESVNLFKILCPHKFSEYKATHAFNTYNKTDYIYFTDDTANKVYLINEGKVKLGYYTESGEEIVKAILSKGEVFGEKAILGEVKRNEFAQSINNNTSICPIDSNTLQNLILDNKKFALGFYKFINFRIKKLERQLQLLLFKDTKTRFLEFINELSEEFGITPNKTNYILIQHPYTQKDMSTLIGTSRPTLNIIMNELKEDGIIDFDRKSIKLFKK